MIILARLLMLLLLLVVAGPAMAAPTVNGTVVSAADGSPLAGAEVSVSGRLPAASVAVETTSADGRFAIDPVAVLDEEELNSQVLTVTFERDGFRPLIYKIITEKPGHFAWDGEAAMVPVGGLSALSAEERERLKPFISTSGRTLMMVPFELVALAEAPSEQAFNTLLRSQLHSDITSYLQKPGYEGFGKGIGIESLEVAVTSTDTERLVALGRYLNALGVIAGDAVVKGGGEGETITLSSDYHLIPASSEAMIAEIGIVDTMRKDDFVSMKIADKLSPIWGPATLIALAHSEMRAARAAGDVQRLRRVLRYVREAQTDVGPGENDFETEFPALIKALEAAIKEAPGQ